MVNGERQQVRVNIETSAVCITVPGSGKRVSIQLFVVNFMIAASPERYASCFGNPYPPTNFKNIHPNQLNGNHETEFNHNTNRFPDNFELQQ